MEEARIALHVTRLIHELNALPFAHAHSWRSGGSSQNDSSWPNR
jgi:hypothetical protein